MTDEPVPFRFIGGDDFELVTDDTDIIDSLKTMTISHCIEMLEIMRDQLGDIRTDIAFFYTDQESPEGTVFRTGLMGADPGSFL